MSVYGVFQDFNRHTAIRVGEGHKWTYFIPMQAGELSIQRLTNREFAHTYKQLTDYPLQRAADKFLNRGELQSVAPQAREHLERILRGEGAAQPSSSNEDEETMTQENQGAEAAPAKKAAKKAPPAPAKKGAAKKEAPAPAKKGAAKKAAEAAPKRGRPREDNATYKIGDTSSVKRGFLADYVAAANKMGTFTRDKIVAKMTSDEVDEAKALRYFYYCTGHGIFVAAA